MFEDVFYGVPTLKSGVLLNWKPSPYTELEDSMGMSELP